MRSSISFYMYDRLRYHHLYGHSFTYWLMPLRPDYRFRWRRGCRAASREMASIEKHTRLHVSTLRRQRRPWTGPRPISYKPPACTSIYRIFMTPRKTMIRQQARAFLATARPRSAAHLHFGSRREVGKSLPCLSCEYDAIKPLLPAAYCH